MNSCKHCMDVKKNTIGETMALCEFSDEWVNVSNGDCFGNCESQEFTPDYIAHRLQELGVNALHWHLDNMVVGVQVAEFEELMHVAARMLLEQK